jgi:uncharacterized protein (TIGR02145 family)
MKNKLKYLLQMRELAFTILISFHIFLLHAQQIENVHFEQDGKYINIFYDLTENPVELVSRIDVYCSLDGGVTWGSPLMCVTGAVGEKQSAGNSKKIVWDVLCENENLKGNILFEVRAITKSLTGTFTDSRDGQIYKWIEIGTQVWMAENMNYESPDGESYCYNNYKSNCTRYGKLYTFNTALAVCPSGWHMPTDPEWSKLEMNLGMTSIETKKFKDRGNGEGGMLKEVRPTFWRSPNFGATNITGFSAIPAGKYESGDYSSLGEFAYFWTSTRVFIGAYIRILSYTRNDIFRIDRLKSDGYIVRCIRDVESYNIGNK